MNYELMWQNRRDTDLHRAMLRACHSHAPAGASIVEVGCGEGHFAEALAINGWDRAYRGYEVNAEAAAVAARHVAGLGFRSASVQPRDFLSLKKPKGADLVVSCGVLPAHGDWSLVDAALRVAPVAAFGIVGIGATDDDVDALRPRLEGRNVLEFTAFTNPARRRARRAEALLVVGR